MTDKIRIPLAFIEEIASQAPNVKRWTFCTAGGNTLQATLVTVDTPGGKSTSVDFVYNPGD